MSTDHGLNVVSAYDSEGKASEISLLTGRMDYASTLKPWRNQNKFSTRGFEDELASTVLSVLGDLIVLNNTLSGFYRVHKVVKGL
jgi:hypothetical protein